MKLVILFGNLAVGKMTVGQELMKITDLRLFHNHMTIELVLDVFNFLDIDIVRKLRMLLVEEFVKTNLYGLIFTLVLSFNDESDWEFLEKYTKPFKEVNAEIYYVELVATQEERLKRNQTENRLKYKPSMRDIEAATQRLINTDNNQRVESYDGEITFDNYIKIDNTNLSAETVAKIIKDRFNL